MVDTVNLDIWCQLIIYDSYTWKDNFVVFERGPCFLL